MKCSEYTNDIKQNKLNINFKGNKGAITLYVVASILIIIIVLVSSQAYISNKKASSENDYQKIKKSYESIDANEVYMKKIGFYDEERDNLLPQGYTQLEYIESTGTQYIDTMMKVNSGDSINITCMSTDLGLNSSQQMICGGRVDFNSTQQVMFCLDIDGEWSFFAWGKNENIKSIIPQLNTMYSIKILNNQLYINDTIYKTYINSFSGDTDIFLFNLNGDTQSRPFYGRIYTFEIKNKMNLIPCKTTIVVKDVEGNTCNIGTIGMYDTVGKKFYTNKGDGDFKRT